jgi:hypothetical protein
MPWIFGIGAVLSVFKPILPIVIEVSNRHMRSLLAVLFLYYFAEHVTGGLLSNEDIRVPTMYLRKMLVLDPNNRAQTDVLLQDPWFTRSDYVLSLKSKSSCPMS